MLKTRIKCLLLSLILMLSMLPLSAFAHEKEKSLDEVARELVAPLDAQITINYDLELIIVSTRVDEVRKPYAEIDLVDVDFGDSLEPMSMFEKFTSATFSHKIYDRNGLLMATAYVTVEGWYSEVDRWSEISDIYCEFEGELARNFSYSTSKNKNNGSITVYFNGARAGGFSYTINYYGRITNVK